MKISYALIGSGRLAHHFAHYFDCLEIPYKKWSRRDDPQKQRLTEIINGADRILILIKDADIEKFIQENPVLKNKILIHCSGQLVTQHALGAHPLMTFTEDFYALETYQKIPFILDQKKISFHELFPSLKNPHFFIPKKLKPFYHALCVMSGNFTSLLWQQFFKELGAQCNIPKEATYPYLEQIFSNLKNNPEAALTGPLVRGDHATIESNLNALKNSPLKKLYQAFVDFYLEK